MTLLLNLLAELAGLVATVGAVLAASLVLRNPHSPAWTKTESVAQATSFVLVTMFAGVLAWATAGMIGAGLHFTYAALIAPAIVAGSGCLLWLAFGIGERLRRADAGRSPFDALGRDLPPRKQRRSRTDPKGSGAAAA